MLLQFKVLPIILISVMVVITLVIINRAKGIDSNYSGNTRWKCVSPGKCAVSNDPNDYDSPGSCNFACPDGIYYDCETNNTSNLHIRTGQCKAVNYTTHFETGEKCIIDAGCDGSQFFKCDTQTGCAETSGCSEYQKGCYINLKPSTGTKGSQQCITECVKRYNCESDGTCTDLGFSVDLSKSIGTCAEFAKTCPNPKRFWECKSSGFGCIPSATGPYTDLNSCLNACCKSQTGGVTCGNTCCGANQQCCNNQQCYNPNECETCKNDKVDYTCGPDNNCSICQDNKCIPQQCQFTLGQTCICKSKNHTDCSCISRECKSGVWCVNWNCPVDGSGGKTCKEINPALCIWCSSDETPCNKCPKIPKPFN